MPPHNVLERGFNDVKRADTPTCADTPSELTARRHTVRLDSTRLAQLRRALILDSGSERAFDDITRLLATSLGVPITMVNLLDEKRDWFKSCVGLPVTESPAVTSFCEAFFHSANQLIVVEDTLLDPRFANHSMVTGPPFIRFYAAARLVVGGSTLGTLCAYDMQPRSLSAEQLQHLQTMANAVVDLIASRSSSNG
jgi:GAF domain-containing protein